MLTTRRLDGCRPALLCRAILSLLARARQGVRSAKSPTRPDPDAARQNADAVADPESGTWGSLEAIRIETRRARIRHIGEERERWRAALPVAVYMIR
jgi:hypothetical protein